MRKILILVMCLIICTVPVFADIETATPAAIMFDYPTDILELISARSVSSAPVGELVSVDKSMMRVSANDSTGFKAVMLSILGDYETVITDYTYQSGSSGYYSHSINIERDWSWICSACIFGLVIFCVFRFIGGLFSR